MEERHVGGADEGGLSPIRHGSKAGGDALHRAEPLDRVFHHLHPGRQLRQLLARRRHDHDRAVHRPGQ